jgi:hypothetical protein
VLGNLQYWQPVGIEAVAGWPLIKKFSVKRLSVESGFIV